MKYACTYMYLSGTGRPIIDRLSSDCRAMNGRWSTDAKQTSSQEWSAVHIYNVNVKLDKSSDRHFKFWSPDHKF